MKSSPLHTLVIALTALTLHARAADPPPVHSPVSPQESLQHFVVEPGLKVELAASEPSVIDPIAIRFDEDGRMWVVEMRDYPTATKGGPRSRISVLTDNDNDGFFESATVFAGNLSYATGIQPWKGGVFVTLAGRVAYMKDTDGDGRADVDETWYTGFAEENTQLRANHPRLALNNHVYVASGLRGGKIVNHRQPDEKPVSISGRDFRFDPLTGECEAVSGCGQFGLTFDDYGSRFICTNRNPAIHVVLEDRDLKKNPLYAPPSVVQDVAKAGEQSRVYPITKSWTTSNLHAGQFTAACGLEIYRGDALPQEYYSNLFVCEPTGHLVHREIMRPKGVSFESTPAHEGVEFLASRDPWFSPVNLEAGPDGALYVVDMYRAVIEHPEWMPDELRHRPDLLNGDDRGRIYRIVPQHFKRLPAPQLSKMSSNEHVAQLTSPNSWCRETAARLVLERQDTSIGPQLRELAQHSTSPFARIHALWLLNGFGLIDDLFLPFLFDSDPRFVEQVLLLNEPRIKNSHEMRGAIYCGLTRPDDARLRFQILLSTMMPPFPPNHMTDQWEVEAMLIAAGKRGGDLVGMSDSRSIKANVSNPKQFAVQAARLAAASPDFEQIDNAVICLVYNNEFGRAGLASLFAESARRGSSFAEVRSKLFDDVVPDLDKLLDESRRAMADPVQSDIERCEAIDLVAVTGDATELLMPLAISDPQLPVRLRAIAALAKNTNSKPWHEVLASFDNATPTIRSAILDATLANPERTTMLLDEIAAGRIQPAQIDINHVNRLLQHRDKAIQTRAKQLFAAAIPQDRQMTLDDYKPVLAMKGDPARGRNIFSKQCATCHRIGNVGINVAPDISDSREKTTSQLLTDILQPNRAIDANYFSYSVTTTEGVTQTGILAAETSTSITLKQAEGKTLTLRRDEIDELASSGVSLMPEGLERLIPPQDMADLLAFIKNWRYLDESPVGPAPAQ